MCTRSQQQNPRVMMYLKLRDEGCSKVDARRFCTRNMCQVDSTQKYFGPPGFKVLEIQQDSHLAQKGWQPISLTKMKLGKRYQEAKDLQEPITKAEQAILEKYKQFEDNKSQKLINKMMAVQNYAQTISVPDLQSNNSIQLCNKLRNISTELRENYAKPQMYIKHGSMKLIEIAKQIPRTSSTTENGPFVTGIPHLNFHPFDSAYPDLQNARVKIKPKKTQSLQKGTSQTQSWGLDSLETESRLIMALQNSPGLSDVIDPKKKKPTPPQAIIDLLKKQTQKMELAEEFNQTQYLFNPSQSHSRTQSKAYIQSDEQMKDFIQQFYSQSNTLTNSQFKLRTQTNSIRSRQSPNKMKTECQTSKHESQNLKTQQMQQIIENL